MKNQNFLRRLGDFALGKGFYIVLFLCVAAIGISGYYLFRSFDNPSEPAASAAGSATVTLPDAQAEVPTPIVTAPPAPAVQNQPEPQPAQPDKQEEKPAEPAPVPDDPEPVAQPEDRPTATVYTWPVNGEILRDFSVETLALDPTLQDWRTHGGLDLAAAEGSKVIAMCSGTVSKVYRDGLMGATVMIDHGNGLTSALCSLGEAPSVKEGDAVETGTVVGTVGNTAIAEIGVPSHIHLETWLNGERVDPMDYLPQR